MAGWLMLCSINSGEFGNFCVLIDCLLVIIACFARFKGRFIFCTTSTYYTTVAVSADRLFLIRAVNRAAILRVSIGVQCSTC